MLLLKRKTFELSTDSPLVKADEAASVANAEAIVAAAEAEAAKIAEDAKAAYAAEKKRGYDDGIAEGREQILVQKLDLLDESVAFMEKVEEKIAGVVIQAMRKCISEIGDKELVVQTVRKALQTIIRNQALITIKVAPAMVDVVKARMDDILNGFPTVTHADVKEDRHLENTACVVETEAGIVESSVERQLAAVEKSIKKSFERRI